MTDQPIRRRAVSLAALVGFISLGACAPTVVETGAQPGGMVLSDANVSSVFAAANNGEIQHANLALERSQNEAVRSFAQRMVKDHTTANEELERILQRARMSPVPVETTEQLERTASETAQTLNELTGSTFDETYIQSQIDTHRWLLETIDNALLPSAGRGDLEELLRQNRAVIAAHLEQAQQIKNSLNQE